MMLPSRIFFHDFFDNFEPWGKMDQILKCDIYEEEGSYIIEMDIPGFKKEDIHMELENGYLKISAEKKVEMTEDENKKYLRHERQSTTRCERKFYVGEVSEDEVKAQIKDNVLKISVPKEEPKKESKKVIMIED
ncbi:MAG: Hsp20 family protein [Bacilli bacterium]|nr:Hsp20 family protein [Bacilli bacterium]